MQSLLMCMPFLSELLIFSIVPIFFLLVKEIIFQYIEFREMLFDKTKTYLFYKILVILQFVFPVFLIFLSWLLSIPYKPALLFGISILTSLASIFILLIILKRKTVYLNSHKYLESALLSLFLTLFIYAKMTLFYYHPPRDHHFPTIICSIAYGMPVFFILFSIFVMFLVKHKIRFFVSVPLSVLSLLVILTQYPHPFISYSFKLIVALLIPLLFLLISIFCLIESKNKSSLWLIGGSLILIVAFLLSLQFYHIYYLYEPLVDKPITQSEFMLIGVFESLYLLAFAFMGLGLLGFRKEIKQVEAVQ